MYVLALILRLRKKFPICNQTCFPFYCNSTTRWWIQVFVLVVVSNILNFHPYLGKWSNLIWLIFFQMGWNHHLVVFEMFFSLNPESFLVLANWVETKVSVSNIHQILHVRDPFEGFAEWSFWKGEVTWPHFFGFFGGVTNARSWQTNNEYVASLLRGSGYLTGYM